MSFGVPTFATSIGSSVGTKSTADKAEMLIVGLDSTIMRLLDNSIWLSGYA
jgi:hypothetical protein